MKKSKVAMIIMLVVFALPVPFSLYSWLGIVQTFSNVDWSMFASRMQGFVASATMVAGGLYVLTYAVSLILTLKKKAISFVSFLPALHIALFVILILVWGWLNLAYAGA